MRGRSINRRGDIVFISVGERTLEESLPPHFDKEL